MFLSHESTYTNKYWTSNLLHLSRESRESSWTNPIECVWLLWVLHIIDSYGGVVDVCVVCVCVGGGYEKICFMLTNLFTPPPIPLQLMNSPLATYMFTFCVLNIALQCSIYTLSWNNRKMLKVFQTQIFSNLISYPYFSLSCICNIITSIQIIKDFVTSDHIPMYMESNFKCN